MKRDNELLAIPKAVTSREWDVLIGDIYSWYGNTFWQVTSRMDESQRVGVNVSYSQKPWKEEFLSVEDRIFCKAKLVYRDAVYIDEKGERHVSG